MLPPFRAYRAGPRLMLFHLAPRADRTLLRLAARDDTKQSTYLLPFKVCYLLLNRIEKDTTYLVLNIMFSIKHPIKRWSLLKLATQGQLKNCLIHLLNHETP